MNFEDISWNTFRLTGDIDAYLLHCSINDVRNGKWNTLKPEESSQDEKTTEKQTAF